MYAEIELSGIEVQDGLVRVRFAFYCEPFDPRYAEHFVHVVDETSKEFKEGYPGKTNEQGEPVDQKDYDKWFDSLPKVWQNNPFHNHFDLVSADITDTELKQLMKKRLKDFGKAWGEGFASDVRGEACEQIQKGWDRNDKHNKTKANYDRCAIKGLDIAARKDSFQRVKNG
jgi:hypothetical protein